MSQQRAATHQLWLTLRGAKRQKAHHDPSRESQRSLTHTHCMCVCAEATLSLTHTRAPQCKARARLNEKSMRIRNICQVAAAHADAGRPACEFHGHIWRTIILRRNSERDQCSSRRRRQNTGELTARAQTPPPPPPLARTAEPKHHQHSRQPTHPPAQPTHTASQPAEVHLFKLLISKPSQPPTPPLMTSLLSLSPAHAAHG